MLPIFVGSSSQPIGLPDAAVLTLWTALDHFFAGMYIQALISIWSTFKYLFLFKFFFFKLLYGIFCNCCRTRKKMVKQKGKTLCLTNT